MKTKKWLLTLIIALLLTGCGSPFAPVVLAPDAVPIIASPAELPRFLAERAILWYGGVLWLNDPAGNVDISLPDDAFVDFRLSSDDRYMVYQTLPLIAGEGLPKLGDNQIVVLDILTGEKSVLVSKEQSFPDAVLLAAPTFTSDGSEVVFAITWEHVNGLAKVNIESGEIHLLDVNSMLVYFVEPDVSKDGLIAAICKGPNPQDLVAEICLLDTNGKFIRYLTSEEYSWPGYGLFTPDGQYVVYESRYKLYKVGADGSNRQQIAPCGLDPILVTDDYVVTSCYVSTEPDCYGLFIASLDGNDFRRIGYVEPHCRED